MSTPLPASRVRSARLLASLLAAGALCCGPSWAEDAAPARPASTRTAPKAHGDTPAPVAKEPALAEAPCIGALAAPTSLQLPAGKSTLLHLPAPIRMRTVADKEVVQARLLGSQTLYLLGIDIGSTNMILQDSQGHCEVVDVTVGMDVGALKAKLAELWPGEQSVRVTPAADTLVLSGTLSDATRVEQAMKLASAYVRAPAGKSRPGSGGAESSLAGVSGQGAQVINMLSVAAAQQVLLEVKVAEVSRTVLDRLGASLTGTHTNGNFTYGILSSFSAGGAGVLELIKQASGNTLAIDANKQDGLVKVLAEPNLVAISGQEGSFLAGGKVFIPVFQNNVGGVATFTLQEEVFGVGLKFTPTVLEGGRINLRVMPEVSELSREGFALQAAGTGLRSILPLITTRRASTTVQLFDGQSFVIGGLVKNNANTDVKAFPVLGEIPVLGALFRSTSFQTEKSELLFVLTPHLVKPTGGDVRLPTDTYVEPSRRELFLDGKLEGSPPAAPPAPAIQ
jgi:pilus assembly protein CpaC